MDEREKTLLVSKAKELGWQVTADESGWVFLMSTQVGETFRVSIPGEDVVGELRKIYCGAATEDRVTVHMDAEKLGIHDVMSLTKLIDSRFFLSHPDGGPFDFLFAAVNREGA